MSSEAQRRARRLNRRHPMLVVILLTTTALVWLARQDRGVVGVASFNVAPEVWVPAQGMHAETGQSRPPRRCSGQRSQRW